jgi:putative phosphoribosyl transferase
VTLEQRLAIAVPGGPVLEGSLMCPDRAFGAVLFAHGSGSSRLSPRNVWVAERLLDARMATVLFDLLSPVEAEDHTNVFDIDLLAGRLEAATDHVRGLAQCADLPVGYFGASTGAAAAVCAAASGGNAVRAVVSRGGRPDLAGDALPKVRAPTLLIVGGADGPVVDLNREAKARLTCPAEVRIVPGAGHLFEEPGALATVAWLAATWFHRFLPDGRGDRDDA